MPATQSTAPPIVAPPTANGVPAELVEAIRSLRTADGPGRRKIYDFLAEKGDTRLIPAIAAYKSGQLQDRDGKLVIYGSPVPRDGTNAFPLLDAFTGQQITGPDGQPAFYVGKRIDLSAPGMMRLPQVNRTEVSTVADLISALSLLDPDPEIRIRSIREAGERAARIFPDPNDEDRILEGLRQCAAAINAIPVFAPATQPATAPTAETPAADLRAPLLAAIATAISEKPADLYSPTPSSTTIEKIADLEPVRTLLGQKAEEAPNVPQGLAPATASLVRLRDDIVMYRVRLGALKKNFEELPKYATALKRQLSSDPNGKFAPTLREANAQMDMVLGDRAARLAAATALGDAGTGRAENILHKAHRGATRMGDTALVNAIVPAIAKCESYQRNIRLIQYTFAGLSTGSIYVLLALGLAVIFGLMGVINMAHGEFMMVGAFTTLLVARWFKAYLPGGYDYFPAVAVPAAFIVSGLVGLATEYLVIRHLYGRTTETLLATIGIGYILVQTALVAFGNSVSYAPPRWMQDSTEVAPDLLLNRARLWAIVYCVICIVAVYFVVNRTRLGLLLRATTQNRQMAAALGVPTRRVDALTFAFGAGLAGMAGVVVPMIDKITPDMGQQYVVMSFMVVVVGGVGKLAGAIIAGFGLGLIGNYLEPALGSLQAFAKTSSVLSKVLVLAAIVAFLQRRPSGLFPPKGRVADA